MSGPHWWTEHTSNSLPSKCSVDDQVEKKKKNTSLQGWGKQEKKQKIQTFESLKADGWVANGLADSGKLIPS